MTSENRKTMRLAAVSFLGFVLFNYPILSLFNLQATVWGLPLLYLYLFTVWVLIILLILLIVHFRIIHLKQDERRPLSTAGFEDRVDDVRQGLS